MPSGGGIIRPLRSLGRSDIYNKKEKIKMKKFLALMLSLVLVLSMVAMVACDNGETEEPNNDETTGGDTTTTDPDPVVESFYGKYSEDKLTYTDTYEFYGKTTDGIITELSFDITRYNSTTEETYDKNGLYGYDMNISDLVITEEDGVFTLDTWNSYGYSLDNGYMMYDAASVVLTDTITFGDLTFTYYGSGVTLEQALEAFGWPADELGLEDFDEDTLLKDFFALYGGYEDGSYVAISTRIAYDGPMGGRTYGEQVQALVDYILDNDMTLEEVYTLFQTTYQDTAIADRTAITGCTISIPGAFIKVVYIAMYDELFEGVTGYTTDSDGNTSITVITQGYGGEITTKFTFDKDDNLTAVVVSSNSETASIGGVELEAGSDFLTSLVTNGSDATVTSGASVTCNALITALELAEAYLAAL